MTSPVILCPKLPRFDTADLEAVIRVFQPVPGCSLFQSWRAASEPDFLPAIASAGWRDSTLFVFGQLTDATVVTFATRAHERLWELGDVFEIFLRPEDQAAYAEFQIAPNNLQLQLRYADADAVARARRRNSIADALVPDISFKSHTWSRPETTRWCVLAEIPAAAVADNFAAFPGAIWRFSFCRYDYTRGRSQPVISSSSALSLPDFHRQGEWGTLQFQA